MNIKCIWPFVIIFLCLGVTGCTNNDSAPALYGVPTTIAKGDNPIDTICLIQEEFRELPKPLMASMSYQPSWTSYKFGAASVDYQGYHKVQLTEAGLAFLQKHSRLEIVLSLMPLFAEPAIGGEAATLLAGIPAGNKSVQRGKTASIANALDKAFYTSPQSPGDWFKHASQYYSRVIGLYSLGNKTGSVDSMHPVNFSNTLEARIIKELHAYHNVPLKLINERPYMPQPHNEELVIEWIAKNTAPVLNQKSQQSILSDDVTFTALAWFPYFPEPQQIGLSRNEIVMMYLLNVEDKYWPAIMQLSSGQKPVIQLRTEFNKLVKKTFSNLCQ